MDIFQFRKFISDMFFNIFFADWKELTQGLRRWHIVRMIVFLDIDRITYSA